MSQNEIILISSDSDNACGAYSQERIQVFKKKKSSPHKTPRMLKKKSSLRKTPRMLEKKIKNIERRYALQKQRLIGKIQRLEKDRVIKNIVKVRPICRVIGIHHVTLEEAEEAERLQSIAEDEELDRRIAEEVAEQQAAQDEAVMLGDREEVDSIQSAEDETYSGDNDDSYTSDNGADNTSNDGSSTGSDNSTWGHFPALNHCG